MRLKRTVMGGAALSLAAACCALAWAGTTRADVRTLTPDVQVYATQSPDTYKDSDDHVSVEAGQVDAVSYVHFSFESLPQGAAVDALVVKFVPNGNATQNQNVSGSPQTLDACLLTQPIPAPFDPSKAPSYDCSKAKSEAQLQPDGSWTIDLSTLVNAWTQIGDTGFALVGQKSSTSDVPPVQGYTEDTWTLGFDHTHTTASIDYVVNPTAPAPQIQQAQFAGAVPGAAGPLPAVAVAPPPSAAPTAAATPAAQPASHPAAPAPVVATAPATRLSAGWVAVLFTVIGVAIVILLGGAVQQLGGVPRITVPVVVGALVASRSRLATQLAVLGLAAIVAAGYTGQAVAGSLGAGNAVAQNASGAGGAGGPGGTAGGPNGSNGPATAPGATGSGASGGAGGTSGGGSPTTTGSGNANGALVPGVTPTTVTIGMSYLTDSNNANATYGAQSSANNYGDTQKEAQAVVDYVNKHGGVAGRQLVIHWQPVSNAEALSDPSGYSTQVCDTYTEDYHVFAVVDYLNNLAAQDCYPQHHTLLVDMSPEQGDLSYYRLMSPYTFSPSNMAVDRSSKAKVIGLGQLGFYSTASRDQKSLNQPFKLGVLVVKNNFYPEVYSKVIVPELSKLGIPGSEVEYYEVSEDSNQNEISDINAAVVQFERDGVNHIMTDGVAGGGEGGLVLFFASGAYKQQYHPLYGLGSSDAPGALSSLAEFQTQLTDQLQGALGVGWAMGNDVEDQNADRPWPPVSGPEKRCMDIEAAAGVPSFSQRSAAGVALEECDSILMLQQAATGLDRNLTETSLASAIMSLGSKFAGAAEYATYLGGDHYDGGDAVRYIYETSDCSATGTPFCFKYKSTQDYAAPSMSGGEP